MAPASHASHPIQTLRQLTKSLERAIRSCKANPRIEAVHRLRTSARRVEAQLALLSTLPGLPPHKEQKRKSLHLLKRLRQAAGQVRDLDVQRDLIGDEAAGRNGGSHPTPEIRKEAAELRRTLKQKRDQNAGKLLHVLKKHQSDFPAVFNRLLNALEPAESLAVPATRLTALIREWYAEHTPCATRAPRDVAQLHDIRKRAKLARYLAETAPESAPAARRLAAQFENLQQAGGEWHDWLLLQQLSASELGDSAKLPRRFSAHADRALRVYRRRLTTPGALAA